LVTDAFEQVMVACVRQFSINEEVLRAEPDGVEAVHQLRVAVRRTRAAMTLFKKVVGDDPGAQAVSRDLKWVSDLLGDARDLDVLLSGPLKTMRLRHPGVEGLHDLCEACQRRRRDARQRLNEAVHTVRFRSLLLNITSLIYVGDWRKNPQTKTLRTQLFCAFARKELNGQLKKLMRKRVREAIGGVDEEKRHAVRTKSKRLRYMAEFLHPISASKRFDKVLDHLKGVQETLGKVHDGVASEQIIARVLARDSNALLVFAAGIAARVVVPSTNCIELALQSHAKLRRGGLFP
jgi:CHAD domain-containing protein